MTVRRLSEGEKRLWGLVARRAKPLAGRVQSEPVIHAPPSQVKNPSVINPVQPPKPKPAAPARPIVHKGAAIVPAERSNEKKVRRGQVAIAGRIDLHGLDQQQALQELSAFLNRVKMQGGRAALVITGKGRMGGGILRQRLPEWLSGPCREGVSGFAPAHRRHGGDGAYYVFFSARPSDGTPSL
jgi:DNA-nicking Smr family endonuclease